MIAPSEFASPVDPALNRPAAFLASAQRAAGAAPKICGRSRLTRVRGSGFVELQDRIADCSSSATAGSVSRLSAEGIS